MTDLASIASILGSVKTATEIAKLLKDSDLSLEKAEMKLKLAELISALADAKIEMAEIQSLLMEKDDRIKTLQEEKKTRSNLTYEAPYYWSINRDSKEGPFCQQCFDKNEKLIRLQGYGNGYWDCKVCGNNYKDSSFRSSGPISVSSRSDWSDY